MSLPEILPEIVVHAAGSDDGFAAAWIHHRFSPRMGEYLPAHFGDDPPDVTDRDVIVVGHPVVYPREVLIEMERKAHSLKVFDHHKTAEATLEGLDFCTFERDKSGARMALEYLMGPGEENWLLDCIEGCAEDVWVNSPPEPELFRLGLASHPRDFQTWDRIYKRGEAAILRQQDPAATLTRQGRHILRYRDRLIAKAIANHVWLRIGDHVVPVAASPIRSLTSDIAGKLTEMDGVPFVAVLYVLPSGHVVYHLRSSQDGINVGEVAREFGGDGYREVAGFRACNMFPEVRRAQLEACAEELGGSVEDLEARLEAEES